MNDLETLFKCIWKMELLQKMIISLHLLKYFLKILFKCDLIS